MTPETVGPKEEMHVLQQLLFSNTWKVAYQLCPNNDVPQLSLAFMDVDSRVYIAWPIRAGGIRHLGPFHKIKTPGRKKPGPELGWDPLGRSQPYRSLFASAASHRINLVLHL